MSLSSSKRTIVITIVLVGVVLGGAYAFMRKAFPYYYAETGVYSIAYTKPVGWTEHRPGPFSLFVFRHPKRHATLSASINEIHAKYNPTPELDTDGIAKHYIDITHANMPEWTAERLEGIAAGNEKFSLIKRTKTEKTVYTAFLSKGNTTVVVSLSAGGKHSKEMDDLLPDFRKVVASFKLTPKIVDVEE